MPPKAKLDKTKPKDDAVKPVAAKSTQDPTMYCVKCKAKKTSKKTDIKLSQSSKGTNMIKGNCPECGTNMSVFISKEKALDYK